MAVRFTNLVSLKKDMLRKGWIVDSFPFSYNGVNTIVVLTLYKDGEKRPTEYTVAKVCFVLRNNAMVDLSGTTDFWKIKLYSDDAFYDFWHIQHQNQGNFSKEEFFEYFAKFIPREKVEDKKDEVERRILGGRAEGNDPSAVYCFDVRRNGRREDGKPNVRSIENSNKAAVLRPELYARYRDDKNLSFFFSSDPSDEKTDEEILCQFAMR